MKQVKVRDRLFQPTGMEIGRSGRLFALSRIIPLGNWGGGPGWRCLVILWLSHNYGRFVFPVLVRYEGPLARIYTRMQRFREKR
jgi:hypothetical protein